MAPAFQVGGSSQVGGTDQVGGVAGSTPAPTGGSTSSGRVFRICTPNLVATASAVTPSTETAPYLGVNVKTPQRPNKPWITVGTTQATLVIDFNSAAALDVIALIHANFTSATLQGNDTDVWTTPSWTEAITIAENPWNGGRYHRAHEPSGTGSPFAYRYLRLVIPAQAPTDGASAFSLGGIWAGLWTDAPRDVHWAVNVRTRWPMHREEPEHKGWSEDSLMGMPIALVRMRRQAVLSALPIGTTGDHVAEWQALDRTMMRASCFLADIGLTTAPEQCLVSKREDTEPEWTSPDPFYPENEFELKEVVG